MSRTIPAGLYREPRPRRRPLRRLCRCAAAGLLISALVTWIITRGRGAALAATVHGRHLSAADVRGAWVLGGGVLLTVILFALTTWFARRRGRVAPASTVPVRTRRVGSPW